MVDKSVSKDESVSKDAPALEDEAVLEFYRIKGTYDKQYNRAKSKIMKTNVSIESKRAKLEKIKLKCVNCKRPVGMRFSTLGRVLKASCGDKTSKGCDLNIEISLRQRKSFDDLEEYISENMNDVKRSIMGFKLRLLFGHMTDPDIEHSFKLLRQSYDTMAGNEDVILKGLDKPHMMTVQDIGGEKEITRKEYVKNINIELNIKIAEFKALIKSHEDAVVPDIKLSTMVDAIDKYLSDITPMLDTIRNSRYKINDVILVKGQYQLIQIKVPLSDKELII